MSETIGLLHFLQSFTVYCLCLAWTNVKSDRQHVPGTGFLMRKHIFIHSFTQYLIRKATTHMPARTGFWTWQHTTQSSFIAPRQSTVEWTSLNVGASAGTAWSTRREQVAAASRYESRAYLLETRHPRPVPLPMIPQSVSDGHGG